MTADPAPPSPLAASQLRGIASYWRGRDLGIVSDEEMAELIETAAKAELEKDNG